MSFTQSLTRLAPCAALLALTAPPASAQVCFRLPEAPLDKWDGSTLNATDDCDLNGQGAPDQQFVIHIPAPGLWTFSLCGSQSAWDSEIFIGESCCTVGSDGTGEWSNDDSCGLLSERTINIPAAGDFYINVDGSDRKFSGDFTLSVLPGERVAVYRVVDLGILDAPVDTDRDGTFGINEKGQVAFGASVTGQMHAKVWLPAPDYGLSAEIHDLTMRTSTAAPAMARDINESGQVVGQMGSLVAEVGDGVVWQLAQMPTATELGFLPGATWSRAHAINDGNPAVVVGQSSGIDFCFDTCNNPVNPSEVSLGFMVELDGTPDLVQIDPFTCWPSSFAIDVNTPASGLPQIIGSSNRGQFPGGMEECITGGGCNDFRRAAGWLLVDEPVMMDHFDDNKGSEARGVNDAGNIVGFGFIMSNLCIPRALFWNDDESGFVNLGDILPEGQEDDRSRAEAIGNLLPDGSLQVVGANVSTNGGALLWERNPAGKWFAQDLNTLNVASNVELLECHDINDQETIVATGKRTDLGNERHVYVLKRILASKIDCPGDVDGNGMVEFADIISILASWGECPLGDDVCAEDTNFDGSVDFGDILVVLATWGPCEEFGQQPASLDDELACMGLTQQQWNEFLANANDPNYRCWLDHYWNFHCLVPVNPFCPQTCPGADPWNGLHVGP